jgi:hypothetical protein
VVNLVTVPGRELMKVGKWSPHRGGDADGGWEVTPELITAAIGAHQAGVLRKPVIRLGHNDPRFTGDPAVGWVDNLYASADGNTLLGDLVGLPEWLGDILPSAYPSVSIEGLYDYTGADGAEHEFILTGLALLGVTPPAIGDLKSVQDVGRLYDITAAGRQIGGTAIEFTIEASASEIEGGAVVASLKEIAEHLGLDPSADADAILAALKKAPDEKPADEVVVKQEEAPVVPIVEPTPAAEPIAASGADTMQVDRAEWGRMVSAAQAGVRAEQRQVLEDDQRIVEAAVALGKFPPSRKQYWLDYLKSDREGGRQVIASLAAGLVPLGEIGHSRPGPEGEPDIEHVDKQRVEDRIFASLGFTKKAGSN